MAVPENSNVTAQQPSASIQMTPMSAPVTSKQQSTGTDPMRLRGGGAGKDCLIGALSCFICFECCKGCVECVADIVCCPCEMCC